MIKKYILLPALFLTAIIGYSQTEKFGMASFTPPTGWQRIDSNGVLVFHDYKTFNDLSNFCQLFLFPGRTSSGKVANDFKEEWNKRVAPYVGNNIKPVTSTQKSPDGWTSITGQATTRQSGITYKCIQKTISGFGRTVSVLAITAGPDYTTAIDKFLKSLQADKKADIAATNSSAGTDKNQTAMNRNITLSDYDFIAPHGWQSQNNKDYLSLQNPQSGCLIHIINPQPSSGYLEQDAKAVFDLMYTGWQYQKSGEQQYVLSKGFLAKGLEYYMIEAPMSKLSADGTRYEGFEDGAALIVKAGDQIVIISARHNSSMMAHGDCLRKYETWRSFFNSFTVKNTDIPKNTGENSSQRIIGSWSQTEAGASAEYVFAANGNYKLIGALGSSYTTSDLNYEYLHIKTYAFEGDGKYSFSGNQLSLKKHKSGTTEQLRYRFDQVNHGGTGWNDRIFLLNENPGGVMTPYEVAYEKTIKK